MKKLVSVGGVHFLFPTQRNSILSHELKEIGQRVFFFIRDINCFNQCCGLFVFTKVYRARKATLKNSLLEKIYSRILAKKKERKSYPELHQNFIYTAKHNDIVMTN